MLSSESVNLNMRLLKVPCSNHLLSRHAHDLPPRRVQFLQPLPLPPSSRKLPRKPKVAVHFRERPVHIGFRKLAPATFRPTVQFIEALPHVALEPSGQLGVIVMMEGPKKQHPLDHRLEVNFLGMQLQPQFVANKRSDSRNHLDQGRLGVVDEVEVVDVSAIR